MLVVASSWTVGIFPVVRSATISRSTKGSSFAGLTNPSFPTGTPVYYVGGSQLGTLLVALDVPASVLLQSTVAGLGSTPRNSAIMIDGYLLSNTTGDVTLNVAGSLFASGDILFSFSPNGTGLSQTEVYLGVAWKQEFNSSVLSIPNISPPVGSDIVAASGSSGRLVIAPIGVSSFSFLSRLDFWKAGSPFAIPNSVRSAHPASSIQANQDPVVYAEQNPPSGVPGEVFYSGPEVGYSDTYGTYKFDVGVYIKQTLYPSGDSAYNELPVTYLGYIYYVPTNAQAIEYESSAVGEWSSYNYSSQGYGPCGSSANSYVWSPGGYGPAGNQLGTTQYTVGLNFEEILPSPFFSVTYTPPSGNVGGSVKVFGDPSPQVSQYENNYAWTFKYTSTSSGQVYANGYYADGEWLLTAGSGSGSADFAQVPMKQSVGIIRYTTATDSRYGVTITQYLETMYLTTVWSMYYGGAPQYSSGGWYTAGCGSSGYFATVTYSTYTY